MATETVQCPNSIPRWCWCCYYYYDYDNDHDYDYDYYLNDLEP